MKTILCPILLVLGLMAAPLAVPGARISEPGTTFYGRISTRVNDREFPVTSGELKWTLASPNQAGREFTLTTQLEPLGGGRFSYRLTIPHQALAFDLSVTGNNFPLTAAGWRMRHVQVLVNGEAATLVPPATDDYTASQASRAGTHRIDLVLTRPSTDSDGDGQPDWWEDQNGTDKWNPNDPGIPGGTGGGTGTPSGEFTGSTFAGWRQHYFPNSTGDLDTFARQDPDSDGIANILEYAFELDPRVDSSSQASWLPRQLMLADRFGIQFHRRQAARDLNYQVEYSQDLTQWRSDSETLEEVAQPGASTGQSCVCARTRMADGSMLFLRVRVVLTP